MQIKENYRYSQYFVFKILFSTYLFVHFVQLIPVGTELFSNQGIIKEANWNLSFPFFPNLLYFFDSPLNITVFLSVLAIASIGILNQKTTKLCALVCWYGFACLFNRNNYISNPSLFYVGWILLTLIVIPSKKEGFKFPKLIFSGGWLVMGLSYTLSGLHKAFSPSWQDGNALRYLLDNPLARNHILNDWILTFPDLILQLLTWSVLCIEITAFIGILFRKTRFITWLSLLFLHLGILIFVNFADLTIGMILFHLFLFNPDWLKKKNFSTVIVFYDGSCGICNRFIQFILKHSTHTQFAPLEGSIARRMLTKKQQKNKDSIIVIKDGITYDKSNAILELMHELDGIYPLLYSLKVLPKYFRNFFYEIFAKYRHHIRKQSTCSLLTTDEQKRFLQ